MIETIMIFRKYSICSLSTNIFGKKYTNGFLLREQTKYFKKILIISVISLNFNDDFYILPLKIIVNEKV